LLESNYVHGNGALDLPDGTGTKSQSVHAMYIQSFGMTLQFNYFGPNRDGSTGGIFKDRSLGSVVRYNWFSQGARILDFVEPQSSNPAFLSAVWNDYLAEYGNTNGLPSRAAVVKAYKQFQKTYVYGNFIRNDDGASSSEHKAAYAPVHFGGDEGEDPFHDGSYNHKVRQGKLYFFNNTVLTYANNQPFQRTSIFDMGIGSLLTTQKTKIEAFNNILHLQSRSAAARPDFYLARHTFENINFGKNWVTSDAQINGIDKSETIGLDGTGVISGLGNLIRGVKSPINLNRLTAPAGSTVLSNAGQALPAELNGITLNYEFKPNHANPLLSKIKKRDNANDLGAASIAP
jgi:hypothetical protein